METFTDLRSQGGVPVAWIREFCCKVNFWLAQKSAKWPSILTCLKSANDHQQEATIKGAAIQEAAIQGVAIQVAATQGAAIEEATIVQPKTNNYKKKLSEPRIRMINLSLNELKLTAKNRNVKDYESEDDLIKNT